MIITPAKALAAIDKLIAKSGRYSPYWGWHDDHRDADGTDAYKPALMQVRAEYAALIDVLASTGLLHDPPAILQLGMGATSASHDCWCVFDAAAATIDRRECRIGVETYPGRDTHSPQGVAFARACAPFDFLFIDAGHSFDDVRKDHALYGPMVRPGGVIAFHDAIARPLEYPEVQVFRYLQQLLPQPTLIGDEVGIAWMIKQ